MEKKDKNLNVPNLRFPEFSGEWERYLLKNITNIYDGTHQTPKYTKSGVPFMSVEDVTQKSSKEQKYISEQDFQNDFHNPPQKGDILMTRIGDIGTPCIVPTNEALGYYVSLALIRPLEKLQSCFLNYVIQSNSFKRELYKRTIHVAFPQKINKEDIGKCKLDVPSIEEQSRIGDLLSLIDERIETQKKIIEKYESLIRGLCEQLTRQGTKNKAINECLDCHTSTLQESTVSGTGEYPVYGATGVCGYTNFNDVKDDGILIIKDGASVGTTYYARGSYSHIGTLNRLTARKGVNLRYVYYCLKVMNFAPYKTGLAIPHIYFKDYGKHRIWCPSYEEQLHIANILTQIDDKIHVEKSLLEQLNSQKRYMLNQLFI